VQGFITGDPLGALNTIANIGKTLVQTDEATAGISLKEAQTGQAIAQTTTAELNQADTREYQNIRTRILTLMENPTPENQTQLRQLARRAAILNPREVLVTKTVTDPETGLPRTITTNIFTGEVQQSATEARIPNPTDWAAAQRGINSRTGKPLTKEERERWNAAHASEYQLPMGGIVRDGSRTNQSAAPTTAPPSQGVGLTRSLESSFTAARPSVGGRTPSREARIPEPPPKTTRGGRPNPDYLEWDRQYGERYRAQQR